MKPARFARIRALHVDNLDDFAWNILQRALAAGFEQNEVALIDETPHQRDNFSFLQQGLSAGDFDQASAGAQTGDLGHDLVGTHPAAAMEGVFAVAPGAAQIASREANEDTGQARVGRLALERFVDFGYLHAKPAVSPQLSAGRASLDRSSQGTFSPGVNRALGPRRVSVHGPIRCSVP